MDTRLLSILNNREQNYPRALAQQYPRILGKIVDLWDTPDIEEYFTDLMVDKRGNRAGFPSEVASDIIYLSMVHARRREEECDPWSEAGEDVQQEIEELGVPFSPEGFIKASEAGDDKAVSLFLKAGMSVDVCDERLWTPLMISAFNGRKEMAEQLIRSGADIHHRDSAGYMPLHWAAFNGYPRVVELLLAKGADVNARSKHGWTALLQAVTRGHLSVSLFLIDKGADVNAASHDGWTPLHKAAANGHLAEVKLLLCKGADPAAKYADGRTALELAARNRHEQVVAALGGRG